MSDIYFSNLKIDPQKHYFLYVGELKNYGLNPFLKRALERIHGTAFDFIAIVPDVFEQYNYANLMVLNPLSHCEINGTGHKYNCRISARDFMGYVSAHPEVRAMVERLLDNQAQLYVYMYESLPEFTLADIPGVTLIGPCPSVAHKLNDKTYQYIHLPSAIPKVDFKICHGSDQVEALTDALWPKWKDGIFITEKYSAAGINSWVAYGPQDVSPRLKPSEQDYLITRYMPHEYDPTVLGVVAGEERVYIAGVADQRIENGNRFTGSTFPSVLPDNCIDALCDHTRTIGRWMGGQGYRGIFGCDYIVDPHGEIYFLEINARKQGTTLEFCCTLEQSLPQGAPSLPEIEYFAVTEGVLPPQATEMLDNKHGLHWGTYNYKLSQTVSTNGYIPQSSLEREAFGKVAAHQLKKDFLILEHIGSDFVVAQGSFLARIVALGHDHDSVVQGIDQGLKTIELTIDPQSMQRNHNDSK